MTPDYNNYNPDPEYVAELLEQIDMLQLEVAATIGVTDRAIRYWLAGTKPIPYSAQFCLESLAKDA